MELYKQNPIPQTIATADHWRQMFTRLNRSLEWATGDQMLLIIRFAENIVVRRDAQ